LLNTSTGTAGPAVASFLSANGTQPNGGFKVYNSSGNPSTNSVVADVVFGGTLAQTPALVQSELNDIANG
ncbi:MAG TPA: hypothetical protein VKU91_02415, partial [Acidimicrobiales bacterium]|nr:hypothetical protein [Acidimicrobiales bacterium]